MFGERALFALQGFFIGYAQGLISLRRRPARENSRAAGPLRGVEAKASAAGQPKEWKPMPETALADLYRAYIACLNRQDWENLHRIRRRRRAPQRAAVRAYRLSRDARA